MNADLPTSSGAQSTPHPDEPPDEPTPEDFRIEYSSGEFPFLPPSNESVSTDVGALNLVFDSPTLREERPGGLIGAEGQPREFETYALAAPTVGSSWSSILLRSYASAVTLALVWLLWTGRRLPPSRVDLDDHRYSEPDLSRATDPTEVPTVVEPRPLLPPQNLTSMGEPIRLGSVEVMPLGVERRVLDLLRSVDPEDWRQTPKPVLVLRVRLRNVSTDRTFSPLEVSSVRECPGIRNETFLESERGRVGMYPLAMESEWALAGQEFPNLAPGESTETFLATAPVAADKLGEILTWYTRLRVSPHQTDVVGVMFSESEIVDE
jgi:hypothetical protein